MNCLPPPTLTRPPSRLVLSHSNKEIFLCPPYFGGRQEITSFSLRSFLFQDPKAQHTNTIPFLLLFNPLNPELNPICYLLALLGAHYFLHVSRIRVKLLTFTLLMYIYIYMEHPFLMFLDHTQRRSTVGRTPLDE